MKEYQPIRNIFLVLTHRCNLECKYCFVHQSETDMPLQIALDSVDFVSKNLKQNQTSSICFFGGEPLLRWADIIVQTVLYAKKMYADKNIKFSITTNCVLLDDEKLQFIKEYNIEILTSIDGAPETQDYNRPFHGGKGSSQIVEKNVKNMLSQGKLSTFRSTIYPPTCHLLFDNYKYAIELGYKSMFFTNDSFSEWSKENNIAVEEQLMKIADHYINYWKENNSAPISITAVEKYFRMILDDRKRLSEGQPLLNRTNKGKCGYGQSCSAAVSPTGELYGCQELTSNDGQKSIFWIGNIYTGTDNSRREQLAELFDETPKTGDINCDDCECKSICHGGCVANNYMQTGDLNHCSSAYCENMRQIYRMANYIIDKLQDNEEFLKYASRTGKQGRCNACQKCQNNQ